MNTITDVPRAQRPTFRGRRAGGPAQTAALLAADRGPAAGPGPGTAGPAATYSPTPKAVLL